MSLGLSIFGLTNTGFAPEPEVAQLGGEREMDKGENQNDLQVIHLSTSEFY